MLCSLFNFNGLVHIVPICLCSAFQRNNFLGDACIVYIKLFGGLVHRDFGLKVIFNSLTLKSNERSFDTNAI